MPDGVGWIALGVCCVALLAALGRGAMPVWSRLTSSCAGLIALGIAAWQIVVVLRAKAEMRADGNPISEAMAGAVSIGAGLYLLAASTIAILAAAIVGHRIRNVAPESTRESSARDQVVSNATAEVEWRRQAPDPREEPPWVIQKGNPRSIVGDRFLSDHGLDTDPREHGAAAAKPTRSFFLWLLIGILSGAGVVYEVLGPPENSAASKAADAPAPAPTLDPCADLSGFHICVDRFVQRRSLSDALSTTTAGDDQTFVLVRVTLSSTRKETADLAWPMFELRDSTRRKWEPDIRSQTTASIGGYNTLDFQQLHPGTAVAGWLVYYVPTSAVSDLHLRFQPGLVRSVDLALPGAADGATCTLGGKTGVCIDVAKCTGTHSAGLCDGPANVQCCVQ